jgi:hypothetical protein
VSEESIALTAATDGAFLMGVESAGNSSFHTNENSVSLQIGVVYHPFHQKLWRFISVPWVPLPVKGTAKYIWKMRNSEARVFDVLRRYPPHTIPQNASFLGLARFQMFRLVLG